MRNIYEAYIDGVAFRKGLTDKTSREMNVFMDRIYQIVKDKHELIEIDEYYPARTVNLNYSAENTEMEGMYSIHESYILQEAAVTWGNWTNAKIKLDLFGIKVYIKKEHEPEAVIWEISWTQYKQLNELFATEE